MTKGYIGAEAGRRGASFRIAGFVAFELASKGSVASYIIDHSDV